LEVKREILSGTGLRRSPGYDSTHVSRSPASSDHILESNGGSGGRGKWWAVQGSNLRPAD